jgi:2-polyprenyl-3-methyl-5-hydroxy-6-metoxy-1,4-benzoquinol methylase
MRTFLFKLFFNEKYRELFISRIKYGGGLREKILLRLLDKYYRNKFHRKWRLSETVPHFENHSVEMFLLGFSSKPIDIGYFYRAFYSSEVIKNGDIVLDIGCGDGFFTKRFYAHKAKKIDAIDIELSAINQAKRFNNADAIKSLEWRGIAN